MARRFFTEADIRRLVKEEGRSELVLQAGDTLTALALDAARELGLRLVGYDQTPVWSAAGKRDTLLRGPTWQKPSAPPAAADADALTAHIVGQVLQRLGAVAARPAPLGLTPVVVSGRETALTPAPDAAPALDLRQAEVVGDASGGALRAGFISWRAGGRNVVLAQDQIVFVVEGVLDAQAQGQRWRLFAGDVALLPGQVALELATPTWVKIFYTHA